MEALSCPLAFLVPPHTCSKKATGHVNIQPYLCMVREHCDIVNHPVTVIIGKEYQVDSNGNILNSEDLIVNDSLMRIALKCNIDENPNAECDNEVWFPQSLGKLTNMMDDYQLQKSMNRLPNANGTLRNSTKSSKKQHSKGPVVADVTDELSVTSIVPSAAKIVVSSVTSTGKDSQSSIRMFSTQETNSNSVKFEITKVEVTSSDEPKIHTKRHRSHKSRRTTKNHGKSSKRHSEDHLIEVLSRNFDMDDDNLIKITESDENLIHVTRKDDNLITVTNVSNKKHSHTLKLKRPSEVGSPRSVIHIDQLSHDSSSRFSSMPSIFTESRSGNSKRLTSSSRKKGHLLSNTYSSMELSPQDSISRTSRTSKYPSVDYATLSGKYHSTEMSPMDSTTTRTSNETADTLGVKSNMSNLMRPSKDQFVLVNRRNPLSQLACGEGASPGNVINNESSYIEGGNEAEDRKRRKKKSKKRIPKHEGSKPSGLIHPDISTANSSYRPMPQCHQPSYSPMDSYNHMDSYNQMDSYVVAHTATTECITRSYTRPYYTDNSQVYR